LSQSINFPGAVAYSLLNRTLTNPATRNNAPVWLAVVPAWIQDTRATCEADTQQHDYPSALGVKFSAGTEALLALLTPQEH